MQPYVLLNSPSEVATGEVRVTGAEAVRWNLADLYESETEMEAALAVAEDDAKEFRERYRGRVGSLDAEGFAEAMEALGTVHDRIGRAFTYVYLHWSTATEDPARGAALQHIREAYTRIGQHLIFFEVEWASLDRAEADALLVSEAAEPFRHYLELKYLAREHMLSEAEENIMAEKAVTGRNAWNRFFDETLGAARFTFRGEALPLQQVLTMLHDADRTVRRDAQESVTAGLLVHQRPLTYVFNTILADKASSDRLRGYDHWLDSRNESNEISRASVDALVAAVTDRYDLVHRFYDLKRRLLGLDVMYDYDRYAPIGEAEQFVPWQTARETVIDAYGGFLPEMADIARKFFDERWIDAPPEPGKRGGAFSHGAVPSAHPYILLNYLGKVRDVQTLAHELGHGIHQYLSREQGIFHADMPLTTAETASVFGEMLVFQRLLGRLDARSDRLRLLVEKIDDTMSTVFRQVAMNRFEDRIHTHRREERELSHDDFGRHWMETQGPVYESSVTLTENYVHWWSYIPHFLHTPGYVYAYAFGELLVLALYARYEEDREGFAGRYRQLLAAGGSDWPHELVGSLGIDLNDPAFWDQGLTAIETLIVEAEAEAARMEAPS